MRDQVSGWVRQRRLAGDARAGAWARNEARRRQFRVVRESWRFFAVGAVLGFGLLALLAWIVRSAFLRGLVLGFGVTAIVGGGTVMVLMLSGTAITGMGAISEQWTASELRPLRRHGWRVVNHLVLRPNRDIDHVLIGPVGVCAVESKWSGRGWQLSPPSVAVRSAIDQVKANAHDLQIWHPIRREGVQVVQPVLFLWTAGEVEMVDVGAPVVIDGVVVITGTRSAERWGASLRCLPASLSANQVAQMWDELAKQAQRRDERAARESPPPTSLAAMYWNALGTVLAGLASLTVSTWLGRLDRWSILAAGEVAAMLVGVGARRIALLRWPALGWIAASTFALGAALVGLVASIF